VAVVLPTELAHRSSPGRGHAASATAIATAFAQTYWWVMIMSVVVLIPAAVLWRVERQARADGHITEASEEAFVEALA
jgi:hypothetical protein